MTTLKRAALKLAQAFCHALLSFSNIRERTRSRQRLDVLWAQSGQSDRTRFCPLLDQSGQRRILAGNGLSALSQSGHL